MALHRRLAKRLRLNRLKARANNFVAAGSGAQSGRNGNLIQLRQPEVLHDFGKCNQQYTS